MRSTVIWSFLSLVTLATGGLISGCDSDAKIAKSGQGESCDKTADCSDGLRCRDQVCVKGSGSGGSGNGEGGEGPSVAGSGNAGPGPVEPVLSGLDESCTKRADCEEGLACFNQRCVMDQSGEGGGGNLPTVRLGALGETCQVSADCDDGLACVPGGQGSPAPIGFQGVCSRPLVGYEPTGMNCTAECKEAADCCELPLAVQVALVPVAESCADLDVALDGVNCAAANVTAANQALCFARDTYCNCTDDTWACEAGQCVYTLSCGAETPSPVLQTEGCPTYSRSGRALFGCNEDLECAPVSGTPACEADADCNGLLMADLAVACEEGECTCYQDTACYRTCYRDLDCAPGKVCDVDDGVCVTEAQCADDADCGSKVGFGSRYSCVDDMCLLTCASDYECNQGVLAGINTLVCAPDGICRAIGCTADSQCSSGEGNTGVKMFCTAPAPAEPGVVPSSAITGGHQP